MLKRIVSRVCYCFQSDAIVIGVLVLSGQISKYMRYDCIFVILAELMTFEQTKSYTATNLCYCRLQKLYFRVFFVVPNGDFLAFLQTFYQSIEKKN